MKTQREHYDAVLQNTGRDEARKKQREQHQRMAKEEKKRHLEQYDAVHPQREEQAALTKQIIHFRARLIIGSI